MNSSIARLARLMLMANPVPNLQAVGISEGGNWHLLAGPECYQRQVTVCVLADQHGVKIPSVIWRHRDFTRVSDHVLIRQHVHLLTGPAHQNAGSKARAIHYVCDVNAYAD